ncbi:MAG: bifunctional precorrin-2 dehydrogenase/sirohydrochlorin ferrochelatase [Eubacterium sp.]|nr:bifunctional precorrin-2 dehydrogenase/sirohydrochlorin ferrochelatase [Eubacterium sp.]
MAYFPMMIELNDRPVLVVGGGEEGTKKVQILQSFGARITLIAEDASEEAKRLSERFIEGSFFEADIDRENFTLVVASTDDRNLNSRISSLAKVRRIPVNVVDDVELCTFIFPAVLKERDVVCAVSSGGKSPYVAQYVRDRLRESLPEDIGEINDKMGELRVRAKEDYPEAKDRRRFLKDKFNELMKKGERDSEK